MLSGFYFAIGKKKKKTQVSFWSTLVSATGLPFFNLKLKTEAIEIEEKDDGEGWASSCGDKTAQY